MSYAAARKKFKSFIRATLLKRERRAVTNYSVKRMVRQLGERLGLKGASARMLRHCFATHLVENGADIRVIQALMGHAFLSTTAIYASVSNIHLESVYRNCHPRA
jgi:site-specific recombinase XerD